MTKSQYKPSRSDEVLARMVSCGLVDSGKALSLASQFSRDNRVLALVRILDRLNSSEAAAAKQTISSAVLWAATNTDHERDEFLKETLKILASTKQIPYGCFLSTQLGMNSDGRVTSTWPSTFVSHVGGDRLHECLELLPHVDKVQSERIVRALNAKGRIADVAPFVSRLEGPALIVVADTATDDSQRDNALDVIETMHPSRFSEDAKEEASFVCCLARHGRTNFRSMGYFPGQTRAAIVETLRQLVLADQIGSALTCVNKIGNDLTAICALKLLERFALDTKKDSTAIADRLAQVEAAGRQRHDSQRTLDARLTRWLLRGELPKPDILETYYVTARRQYAGETPLLLEHEEVLHRLNSHEYKGIFRSYNYWDDLERHFWLATLLILFNELVAWHKDDVVNGWMTLAKYGSDGRLFHTFKNDWDKVCRSHEWHSARRLILEDVIERADLADNTLAMCVFACARGSVYSDSSTKVSEGPVDYETITWAAGRLLENQRFGAVSEIVGGMRLTQVSPLHALDIVGYAKDTQFAKLAGTILRDVAAIALESETEWIQRNRSPLLLRCVEIALDNGYFDFAVEMHSKIEASRYRKASLWLMSEKLSPSIAKAVLESELEYINKLHSDSGSRGYASGAELAMAALQRLATGCSVFELRKSTTPWFPSSDTRELDLAVVLLDKLTVPELKQLASQLGWS